MEQQSNEHKAAQKAERQAETVEVLNPLVDKIGERFNQIDANVASVQNEIKEVNDKLDRVADGTLSTLRNDILNCYYKCREKGFRNDYDYTNIHDLWDAYKALNGNSFVEDVMNRFDNLPPKEEFKASIDGEKTKEAKKQKLLEDK